jgi:hypothetical protein
MAMRACSSELMRLGLLYRTGLAGGRPAPALPHITSPCLALPCLTPGWAADSLERRSGGEPDGPALGGVYFNAH